MNACANQIYVNVCMPKTQQIYTHTHNKDAYLHVVVLRLNQPQSLVLRLQLVDLMLVLLEGGQLIDGLLFAKVEQTL